MTGVLAVDESIRESVEAFNLQAHSGNLVRLSDI